MRYGLLILAMLLMLPTTGLADKPARNDGVTPGQVKKGGVPPGLAKKGGLPPGLARKFGPAPPARAYVAFDPRYDDRAWFLIDSRWVLRQDFDPGLRIEVRGAMALPSIAPPVPLPAVGVALRVVLFD